MSDQFEHCARALEYRALEIICGVGPQSPEDNIIAAQIRADAFNEAAAFLRAMPMARARRAFLARLRTHYRAKRNLGYGVWDSLRWAAGRSR